MTVFGRVLGRCVLAGFWLVLAGCGEGGSSQPSAASVTLLAAASTSDSVEEAVRAFRQETGIEVKISTGASNALANQILAGAPADVFLSANRKWAAAIVDKGLAERSQPLLTNRLVLIVPQGNPANVKTPQDLVAPRVEKLALAGENVPAGIYAGQALRSLKLLDALTQQQKIARGQDVRVTLVYVERGEAAAGVVYSTDAQASRQVEVVYTFPSETHDEVVYPLVLLKRGADNDAARRFFEYLQGGDAAAVFQRHGFQRIKPSRGDAP